ncbi:MAG TPA: ribulose bisphosphate carboxylase small subunit [Solirubrobacteraceae bacterium]|nr:ribulose bisphosphate carboxylase small subunit [Solirubrobacteraceae bacterium]
MRLTQGTFSFLPDLTDEQIAAQIAYALGQGWSMSIEHTDDPHPRNSYWEMWGLPMFDLGPEDVVVVLREVRAAREAYPAQYIKLIAYDSSYGRQTTALSFIVHRPPVEPGFRLERAEQHDRTVRYQLHAYATDQPAGSRYGAAPSVAAPGGPATNGAGANGGAA